MIDKDKVPYYDPQTGEPNPRYEELTGKPNPLLEARLPKIDFKKRNRYLVHFPVSFNVKPEQVGWFKLPTLVMQASATEFDTLEIEIREYSDTNTYSTIYEYMLNGNDRFDLKIELVDSKDIVIDTFNYEQIRFKSIECTPFSYSDDNLMTFKVFITV